MSLLCALIGHIPFAAREHNQDMDFSICHYCGTDLIRSEDSDWSTVPAGQRVVRRAAGRDADSVAQRLHRVAPPPPRRDPRISRPAPHRDRRGRASKGGPGTVLLLANLGWLAGDDCDDGSKTLTRPPSVIRLPGERR
ncbi:hypothetical protein [Sphingomonas sp. M1-B02]|uniref:hypothetical protein n=1 Tax=Sphingomonas sp. M1-B02 TaxID=3114300 RepID=UPI00223EE960|nr:hypothetical protein [Sphingomonas sp. S6-11]UZK67227.1 hypothetical protein OKW87_05180 [Sphingomonas sp. S6-11]